MMTVIPGCRREWQNVRSRLVPALLRQLEVNLRGLRVEQVRTEVAWDQLELMTFLAHAGFRPAPRFCLERRLG